MDRPREHYAKWKKPVRERFYIWFHPCVGSNEQTELTTKIEVNSQMKNRWQLVGGRLRSGRIEQKWKRTQGHGQQCGDYVWVEGIRELNGNGKKYNKN